MFLSVELKREIKVAGIDHLRLKDALMRFAFSMGYVSSDFKELEGVHRITSGTIMSLDPNTLKHTITIDYSSAGSVVFSANAKALPWAGSKVRDIISYRLVQLLSHMNNEGIALDDAISEEERSVAIDQVPFTHLPGSNAYYTLLQVLLSMLLCITGVILTMWIYGALIINITDSRLLLEVTFGNVPKADLIGGGSVIGIAIGWAVGILLSIYFALSELIGYLNERILSFAIFYAAVISLFIIEEEAFIITSVIAVSLPFVAYAFYSFVWGLKKVYIKGVDE